MLAITYINHILGDVLMKVTTLCAIALLCLTLVGCGGSQDPSELYDLAQKEVRGGLKHASSAKFPPMPTLEKITDSLGTKYKSDSLIIRISPSNIVASVAGYCYAQNGFGVYGTHQFSVALMKDSVTNKWEKVSGTLDIKE
ncbi:MAG: hypothetical protein JNJ94_02785 [Chlorobi bacterium]|nr:hypothetical protein [Chlorobiota bacterium]